MEIKEKFIDLVDSFLNDINGANVQSPYYFFEQSLKSIPAHWIKYLIPSIPEIFFSSVGKKKKLYGELIELWNQSIIEHPSQFEGVLTCHALSPMGDTISLISDLGRSLRIASSFNKKLTILYANKDWTRLNWAVKDYGEHNLIKSEQWRSKLYKSVGAISKESHLDNAKNISRKEIESLASSFTELSRAFLGNQFIGHRLASDELTNIKSSYYLKTTKTPEIDLLENNLIKRKLGIEINVIDYVIKNLHRLDENTFIYYFTQRFHQHYYDGYFKIAVRSEKNFDEPFYNMDLSENSDEKGITTAFYFRDYVLSKDEKGDVFVIPYYFPSGSLYNGKLDIESYTSSVIMLDDYLDKQKFVKLFNAIPFPHNARLLSDFLSFIHFYIRNPNHTTSKFQSDINKIIDKHSPELKECWNYYLKSPKDFSLLVNTWSDYLFAKWPQKLALPYYYYPYLVLDNDTPSESITNLFFELFSKVINEIGNPIWHKS